MLAFAEQLLKKDIKIMPNLSEMKHPIKRQNFMNITDC